MSGAPDRGGHRDHWRSDPLAVLLPLRGFLGLVFVYAGLSKIADRTFLDDSSPSSMHASILAVKASSPIGSLLGPAVDHSFAFGLVMAMGEVAVGLGTLLGLFHRVAAFGGIVLALSLFLTVSWGANPWYTGADIGYVLAFSPLILSAATPFSADAWLAAASRRRANDGADAATVGTEDRTRRAALGGLAAVAGVVAVAAASLKRGPSKPVGTSATGSPAVKTSAPAGSSTVLAKAIDVPVGGATEINDPDSGDPVWLMQLEAGKFTALSAACPHQGCPVKFVSKSTGFVCPCHQSAFTAAGKVQKGPANSDLMPVAVTEAGGNITRG